MLPFPKEEVEVSGVEEVGELARAELNEDKANTKTTKVKPTIRLLFSTLINLVFHHCLNSW